MIDFANQDFLQRQQVAALKRKWMRIIAWIVAVPAAVWIVVELGNL